MSATLHVVTGLRPHVARSLVDGQLLLPPDPECLVVLAVRLQDVCDLAHCDGPGPDVAQPLVNRQTLLPPRGKLVSLLFFSSSFLLSRAIGSWDGCFVPSTMG
jgi:hypothetical protein